MNLTLHIATAQDAEAISTLVNSAYRGEGSKRGWTTEADLIGGQRTDAEALREDIANPQNTLLYFQLNRKLVASVFLQNRKDCAYLGMLTVSPELQAGGIGKKILGMIENWIKQNWKLRRIEISVIQKRLELLAWYHRRGYVDTGRREPFPYHNPRVGNAKFQDLEMIILEKLIP